MCRIIVAAVAATGASLCAGARAELDFEPPVLYPPGTGAIIVRTADVDGDGDQDVVVANFGDADGGLVSVLRGAGDGTLGQPETYLAGTVHLAVELADLNGDGAPDIALANFDAGTVSVLLNAGDGTYSAPIDYPAGVSIPRAIAAGDVDGDGDRDLVVGDAFVDAHAVLFNDGEGGFPTVTGFPGATTTIDVALADLDGDGDLDAVFVFSDLTIHRNDGAGGFDELVVLETCRFSAVTVADLDGDGDPDIAAARSGELIVYLNDGAGETFVPAVYAIPQLTRDVAAGDFDDDGLLDLVTSHVSDVDKLAVLRNLGGGSFAEAVEFPPGIYPQSVAAADLDGDRRDDIVTALQFDDPPSVSVLISASTSQLAGDIDGDGVVGVGDLLELLLSWGACPAPPADCPADIDGDGSVTVADLVILLSNWS